MTKNLRTVAALGLGLCLGHTLAAEEPRTGIGPGPNPVPLTARGHEEGPRRLQALGPRLPLPPVSEEEKAKAAEASKDPAARTRGLGGGIVNNGRMRSYYLSDYADGSRGGLFGLGGFGGGSSANRAGRRRPRSGTVPRQRVPDDAVLDRLAGEQLHVLHGAPGVEARRRRPDRRPDRRPRRRLVGVRRAQSARPSPSPGSSPSSRTRSPTPTSPRSASTTTTPRSPRSSSRWPASTR